MKFPRTSPRKATRRQDSSRQHHLGKRLHGHRDLHIHFLSRVARSIAAKPPHFLWMWSRRAFHELDTDAEKVENRVQLVIELCFHLSARAYVDQDALKQTSLSDVQPAEAHALSLLLGMRPSCILIFTSRLLRTFSRSAAWSLLLITRGLSDTGLYVWILCFRIGGSSVMVWMLELTRSCLATI